MRHPGQGCPPAPPARPRCSAHPPSDSRRAASGRTRVELGGRLEGHLSFERKEGGIRAFSSPGSMQDSANEEALDVLLDEEQQIGLLNEVVLRKVACFRLVGHPGCAHLLDNLYVGFVSTCSMPGTSAPLWLWEGESGARCSTAGGGLRTGGLRDPTPRRHPSGSSCQRTHFPGSLDADVFHRMPSMEDAVQVCHHAREVFGRGAPLPAPQNLRQPCPNNAPGFS